MANLFAKAVVQLQLEHLYITNPTWEMILLQSLYTLSSTDNSFAIKSINGESSSPDQVYMNILYCTTSASWNQFSTDV